MSGIYGYDYYNNVNALGISAAAIWVVVSFVIAVIGGILLYFLFIKDKKSTNNKYLNWIKEFFNFQKMLIEDLLKVSYLVLAIFITLYSFVFIASNFIAFILMLTLGNVILRVVYEGCLVLLMIWKNTTEINKKLKK